MEVGGEGFSIFLFVAFWRFLNITADGRAHQESIDLWRRAG